MALRQNYYGTLELLNGQIVNVCVDLFRKPIPTTSYDWDAWIDGHEELGTGHGPDVQSAMDDLGNLLTAKDLL